MPGMEDCPLVVVLGLASARTHWVYPCMPTQITWVATGPGWHPHPLAGTLTRWVVGLPYPAQNDNIVRHPFRLTVINHCHRKQKPNCVAGVRSHQGHIGLQS